jgi:hypothetical protein
MLYGGAMPRRRKVGITHFSKILTRYLLELVVRDPLTHNFLASSYYEPQSDEDWKHYHEHQSKFIAKWGVNVKPLPPGPSELPENQIDERVKHLKDKKKWDKYDLEAWCQWMFAAGIKPKHIRISNSWWPLQWTVNGGCVGRELNRKLLSLDCGAKGYWDGTMSACLSLAQGSPVEGWDGYHRRQPCFGTRRVSLDQAHTVTLEVDLAGITTRNLEDIVVEIKKVLGTVLPLAHKASKRNNPKELDFLRTITPRVFTLALRAYDLHIDEGLSFVKIARKLKSDGFRISAQSVEENVKKLHRAIFRAPYTAKRRRIDTPAQGVPVYDCPDHQRACPETCQHMKQWESRIYKTLPTDFTGAEWPR